MLQTCRRFQSLDCIKSLDCITFLKVLVFTFMVKSQKRSSIDYCDSGEFNLKSIYLKCFRFSFIVSSFVGNPAVQEDCRWINFMSFIHDYAKTFIRTRVSKYHKILYIYHYSYTLHIICAQ